MTYVPGVLHDLFFSYAHDDDPNWQASFEGALRAGLFERLGEKVSIWKDTTNLRVANNWESSIEESINQSAAFLLLISPIYLKSLWCLRERRHFLEHEEVFRTTAAPREERFVKVIRRPDDNGAHLELLPKIQHVAFYDEENGSDPHTYSPDSPAFGIKIQDVVKGTAALLRSIRRSRQPVFVAAPADDVLDKWTELTNELKAQGFDVPVTPIDSSYSDSLVEKTIEGAILSVFLLKDEYDSFVQEQIQLSRDMKKAAVFWIPSEGVPLTDYKQNRLVERIRSGEFSVPGGSVVEAVSTRSFIQHVLEKLKSYQPDSTPRPPSARPTIYLLYDPTTEQDPALATEVRGILSRESFDILEPTKANVGAASEERHWQILKECDGVLLCRAPSAPPDRWLRQTVPDVLFAERQLGRTPIASKAYLLGYPDEWGISKNIIPLGQRLSLSSFNSFLAPLRKIGESHVAP